MYLVRCFPGILVCFEGDKDKEVVSLESFISVTNSLKLALFFDGGENKVDDSNRRNVRRIRPSSVSSLPIPKVGSIRKGSNHRVTLSICSLCFGTDTLKNALVNVSFLAGKARTGWMATCRVGLSGTASMCDSC